MRSSVSGRPVEAGVAAQHQAQELEQVVVELGMVLAGSGDGCVDAGQVLAGSPTVLGRRRFDRRRTPPRARRAPPRARGGRSRGSGGAARRRRRTARPAGGPRWPGDRERTSTLASAATSSKSTGSPVRSAARTASGSIPIGSMNSPPRRFDRVVAGGAVDRPRRELLARLEDLLDDDPRVRRHRPQPVEVGGRIAEPVGMVDPDAVDGAVAHPGPDQPVGEVEDRGLLDPDPGQIGHVEEPPVVELVGAGAPEREPVVLGVEQLVEQVDRGVDGGDRPLPVVGAAHLGQRPDPQREHRVAVAHHHLDGEVRVIRVERFEPQLASLEHPAVVIAEDGQQHGRPQLGLRRVPVDVERLGHGAVGALAQQAPPPAVPCRADRHVVRDDVEHLTQPGLGEGAAPIDRVPRTRRDRRRPSRGRPRRSRGCCPVSPGAGATCRRGRPRARRGRARVRRRRRT